MIIVSQEKDAILNFDNVIGIRTAVDIESKKEKLIAIDTIEGERYYIAKYATEERTKEVLEEIIEKMQNKSFVEMTAEGVTTEVSDGIYRMPKE